MDPDLNMYHEECSCEVPKWPRLKSKSCPREKIVKNIRMLKRLKSKSLQNTISQVLETHLVFTIFFRALFIYWFKSQNYARNFSHCNFTSFSYKFAVLETHLVFTNFFLRAFLSYKNQNYARNFSCCNFTSFRVSWKFYKTPQAYELLHAV